ncbi:MAG: Translation initiation factor eIF-2B subunit beta [Stictis urceolatum]|nr:Translation initiation factor eIF-2B subunit beta [Stictis urceolata]
MAAPMALMTPGLPLFLKSLKTNPVESSIENLISLLKRREIRNSRPCAIATARLLRIVVAKTRFIELSQLIERVQQVGQRLTAAQPREIAVGNIVRRVLGVIRDESEEDRDNDPSETDTTPSTPKISNSGMGTAMGSPLKQVEGSTQGSMSASMTTSGYLSQMSPDSGSMAGTGPRPPMLGSHASYAAISGGPLVTSMFSLLSHPFSTGVSPAATPGSQSPATRGSLKPTPTASFHSARDLKSEVVEGIDEIIEELDVVDDQISSYALEHIHSNEIVLVTGSSTTVQKFLLKAAAKRTFTVFHAEGYPNNHLETHEVVAGAPVGEGGGGDEESGGMARRFSRPLIAAGITVVLIPDAAVFALMSRVNKVILGTHVVLANGGLVAAAGTKTIAQAAREHRTPVVVVSGVYKLSPLYPFDFDALIEYGDSGAVFGYEDGDLVDKADVENPLYDYVPPELVDLYITNLGGHAPSYLYRIVSDHYRDEDTNLAKVE